jgi:hypothetical protein
VFRPQVDFLPVMPDIGESVATDHGAVVSLLVVVRGEGSLKVVSSPGDVSPGRILTTIMVVVKVVGHVGTNGVGVVELLHERTSGVRIGDLVRLVPGMVNN